MENLYNAYKDIADFRIVYINEAHPCDGGEPSAATLEKELYAHRSWQSRQKAAALFVKDKHLTIPCLIDNLDNLADLQYHAWPDKVYLLRSDHTVAVVGEDGPVGFDPALRSVTKWLAEFRESSIEPEPIVLASDFKGIVGSEVKPTGPQEELLEQIDALNKQKEERSSRSEQDDRPVQAKEFINDSEEEFDEAAHERERLKDDKTGWTLKPWHIFVCTILLIGLAILVSRGSPRENTD